MLGGAVDGRIRRRRRVSQRLRDQPGRQRIRHRGDLGRPEKRTILCGRGGLQPVGASQRPRSHPNPDRGSKRRAGPLAPELIQLDAHDGVIAVDKPAGLPVHRTDREEPDLASLIAEQWPGCAPVHRLDRGTSGVVLCAEGAERRRELSERFAAGDIAKIYIALVHGRIRAKGTVRVPLNDARRARPREAVTRYTRIVAFDRCSLVRVRPATGRKHQIRRHLEHLGHPVIGDDRYRGRRSGALPGAPDRLWLHAWRITIDEHVFAAPLPSTLVEHLAALGWEWRQ